MPGRDVSIPGVGSQRRGRRRVVWAVGALTLLAIGIAIGSRIASPRDSSPPAPAATTFPGRNGQPTPGRPVPAATAHTRAGAIAAAARSITAFGGDVLLKLARLRALVGRIASNSSRARLIEAFEEASAQTRAKLGADTVPRPVILLRAVPVGYRVDRYSAARATVAVWYVGIVGSGATVQPQQSWRTQTVSLVWEKGAWKVSSFASSAGPTPALTTTAAAEPPGELFAAIPRFQEFRYAVR